MTETQSLPGNSTQGKPINLAQLQTELEAAGVDCSVGLGLSETNVFTYANAQPTEFPSAQQPIVDTTIANHVGMRDKTDAEYAVEFQDANTTATRKQEIRDQQSGLLPREQVPMP
jgi:hypothetical protein